MIVNSYMAMKTLVNHNVNSNSVNSSLGSPSIKLIKTSVGLISIKSSDKARVKGLNTNKLIDRLSQVEMDRNTLIHLKVDRMQTENSLRASSVEAEMHLRNKKKWDRKEKVDQLKIRNTKNLKRILKTSGRNLSKKEKKGRKNMNECINKLVVIKAILTLEYLEW